MDRERIKEVKKRIAEIRKQNDEWAKTPEGREFDLRMVFVYNLLKVMKSKKMAQADLCDLIGMRASQFTRIIQANENITIRTISRIADVVSCFNLTPKQKKLYVIEGGGKKAIAPSPGKSALPSGAPSNGASRLV